MLVIAVFHSFLFIQRADHPQAVQCFRNEMVDLRDRRPVRFLSLKHPFLEMPGHGEQQRRDHDQKKAQPKAAGEDHD